MYIDIDIDVYVYIYIHIYIWGGGATARRSLATRRTNQVRISCSYI